MEVLKLNLTNNFLKGVITKIITTTLNKKLGYDIGVYLNEVQVTTEGGKVRIHADIDADIANDDLLKVIKSAGLF